MLNIKRHKRTAVIEQPQSGPTNYLVTLGGGECVYASTDDGAAGFTWVVESDDCVAGCGACATVDADFLTEHGAPTALGETLTVACPDCTGPRWTGTLRVPTGDTLRTSITRRIYNIQQGDSATPATGDTVWVRQYLGQWLIVGQAETTTPVMEPDGTHCACCNCLECVERSVSSVVGCSHTPNHAPFRYTFDLGYWVAFPELGGVRRVDHVSGCTWESEHIKLIIVEAVPEVLLPFYIPAVVEVSGTYKWVLQQAGDLSTLQLVWVSGEDPVNLGGGGGECVYASASTGAGGFIWTPESNDCVSGCAPCPDADAAFYASHGTPTGLGQQLRVICPSCPGATVIKYVARPPWSYLCEATMLAETGEKFPADSAGVCRFVSVSDGSSGFTWEGDGSTCLRGCGDCPIVDAEFLADHGTPTGAGQRLEVACSGCGGFFSQYGVSARAGLKCQVCLKPVRFTCDCCFQIDIPIGSMGPCSELEGVHLFKFDPVVGLPLAGTPALRVGCFFLAIDPPGPPPGVRWVINYFNENHSVNPNELQLRNGAMPGASNYYRKPMAANELLCRQHIVQNMNANDSTWCGTNKPTEITITVVACPPLCEWTGNASGGGWTKTYDPCAASSMTCLPPPYTSSPRLVRYTICQ